MKKISLKRRIAWIMGISGCLFFLLQCVLVLAYSAQIRKDNQSYLEQVIDVSSNSLRVIETSLDTIGNHLAFAPAFQELYQSDSFIIPDAQIQNADDLAQMAVRYNDYIDDVLFISTSGIGRSYASGLGGTLVDLIRPYYDFSAADASGQACFYFPDYQFPHDPLFAYVLPFYSIGLDGAKQRLGTILLACNVSSITQAISMEINHPYRVTVQDTNGFTVTSYQTQDFLAARQPLTASRTLDSLSLTVVASLEYAPARLGEFFLPFYISVFLLYGITVLTFLHLSNRMVIRPFALLTQTFPGAAANTKRLTYVGIEEFDIIIQTANNLLDEIEQAHEDALTTQTRALEAELRRNEAELYALQSQINPHFLFNTLQCLRSLALMHNVPQMADVASGTAALMRYAIQGGEMVSLGDELDIINQYVLITEIRYQHKIQFHIDVKDTLRDQPCLRMSIQPLVENAVSHGLAAVGNRGQVWLRGYVQDAMLVLEVEDNGAGISQERLEEIRHMLSMDFQEAISKNGLKSFGLYNINRRAKLAFGDRYGIQIRTESGHTYVSLRLPYQCPALPGAQP